MPGIDDWYSGEGDPLAAPKYLKAKAVLESPGKGKYSPDFVRSLDEAVQKYETYHRPAGDGDDPDADEGGAPASDPLTASIGEAVLRHAPSPKDPDPLAPNRDPKRVRMHPLEIFARGNTDIAGQGLDNEAAGVGGMLNNWHEQVGKAAASVVPQGVLDAVGYDPVEHTQAAGRGIDAPTMGALEQLAKSYRGGSDAYLGANKQAFEDDKALYRTGEAFGLGTTIAAPFGKAKAAGQGLKFLARMRAAAPVAAKVGALNAFGASESGDPLDVAKDTAIGFGAGGVLGPLAGETVGGVVRGVKAVPGLARKAAGKVSDMVGGAVDRGAATPMAREIEYGTPELARTAEKLVAPESTALRANALRGGDDQAIAQTSQDLGKKVDELLSHGEHVKWDEDIAAKGDHLRGMMKKEPPPPDGLPNLDTAYDTVKREFDTLVSDVEKGQGATELRRLQREAFDAYENRLKKALENYDPRDSSAYMTERYMALDDVKRKLQQEVARGRVPFDDLMRDRMAAPLQKVLEDPAVVGTGPAALQKMRNAGWTRRLRSQGSPEQSFLATSHFGESGPDPYRVASQHDPGKLHSIVSGAGTPQGELPGRNLTDWADREAGLLEALTGHEGADPALAQRAQRARQLAGEIRSTMGTRSQEARAAADLQRVRAAPSPEPGLGRKAVELIPYVGKVAKETRPEPIGDRAARMAALERVAALNPGNTNALRDLATMGSPVAEKFAAEKSAATPMMKLAQSTARLSAPPAASAVPPLRAAAQPAQPPPAKPQGADDVRSTLQQNPQAYGQWSDQLQRAASSADRTALPAELYRLQQDPEFRKQYMTE